MSNDHDLIEVATVLRSRSADPFVQTIDIFFDDRDVYDTVKKSEVITKDKLAAIYGLDSKDVYEIIEYDQAMGIKVAMKRLTPSGYPGDNDPYGVCPQMLLFNLKVPRKK